VEKPVPEAVSDAAECGCKKKEVCGSLKKSKVCAISLALSSGDGVIIVKFDQQFF
jgi:hypothetical protein